MKIEFGIIALASISLSACGSSGGGSGETRGSSSVATPRGPVISQEEDALRMYADTDGDAADMMAKGDTVTARRLTVSAKGFDHGNGTSQLVARPTVSLAEDGETLILKVDDETYELTDADLDGNNRLVRNYADGRYVDLVTLFGTIEELRDENTGTGLADFMTVYADPDGSGARRVFFVVGGETRDAALPDFGSVTYTGNAYMRFDPETGFDGEPTSTIDVAGDLTMSADFKNGNVSGAISQIGASFPDDTSASFGGSLQLEETEFTQNAFTGRLVPDSDFLNDPGEATDLFDGATGTFSGVFYGGAAEEVGGALTTSGGSYQGVEYNGTGGYLANAD